LDATARRIELPSGRPAILSDTVGFISDLPVQLVDAFRATLEEVVEADVLLHVVDASSPQALEQRDAVLRVLRELGMMEDRLKECVIEVWNKTDLLEGEGGVAPSTGHVLKRQAGDGFEGGGLSQGCAFRRVYVSVARNSGFSELRQVIDAVTGGLDPKEWAGQQHATEQGN